MAEEKIAAKKEKISFEGMFKVKDVYKTIQSTLKTRGYKILEKSIQESVTKTSKNIERELEASKKISDYVESVIKLNLMFKGVKEVKIKRDKKTHLMNQGKAIINIEGILKTDYKKKDWATTRFFWKALFDKFVYSSDLKKFEEEVKEDAAHLKENLKAFFNLYK